MIKAVHIEDEPRNIELLASLLKTHCSRLVELCGHAKTIAEGIELIKAQRPQLVYLDIELSKGNAFELLEILNRENLLNFQVIFITAYDTYAVKAFRYQAIDYLLKPISIEELMEATERAISKIESGSHEQLLAAIRMLNLQAATAKIGLPTSDGILFLDLNEIVRIEALGSYCVFYMQNKQKITATRTLKEIEEQLPESLFLRVHHSWIINLKYLRRYYRGRNGYIEMDDGSTVAVSIRKKGRFLDLF